MSPRSRPAGPAFQSRPEQLKHMLAVRVTVGIPMAAYLLVGFVGIGVIAVFAGPATTLVFTLVMIFLTLVFTSDNQNRLDEIHGLVNSRLTSVMARVEQLTRVLEELGVPVPPAPDNCIDLAEAARIREGSDNA